MHIWTEKTTAISSSSFLRYLIFFCVPAWADAASMYGEISSPNYPQVYPNDVQESWDIQVPSGYGIRLYFTHMDLEPSQNCEYDFVKVLSTSSSEKKTRRRVRVHNRKAMYKTEGCSELPTSPHD